MLTVAQIHAREILDSRGNPTVEVDLTLSDGSFGRASVPSGASTGSHEVLELRDGDDGRYGGKGVLKAVANVNNEIAQNLHGTEADQQHIDQVLIDLDGTENKSRLGANAILGVSLALAHALSASRKVPLYNSIRISFDRADTTYLLPVPLMNFLNGGKHATKSTDLQEFMVIPFGAPSFSEALEWGHKIYNTLAQTLLTMGFATTVGDEGGFAPTLPTNTAAVALLAQTLGKAGFSKGEQVGIGIDAAASEFYEAGVYKLVRDEKTVTTDELLHMYEGWIAQFPVISIEDGFFEDDWGGFKKLVNKVGKKIQVVGDDLFATNVQRLQKGIDEKAANAILVKVNQIGTLTETAHVVALAQKNKLRTIISHRSGETEDTTIADIAVAFNCGQIKTGSVSRSERIAKYNRLLRIAEELGHKAIYAGMSVLK